MKATSVYRCQACGFQAGKGYGRCPDCGEFNTMVEERPYPFGAWKPQPWQRKTELAFTAHSRPGRSPPE